MSPAFAPLPRTVLLGDSHLARIRNDLTVSGQDVCNGAKGGASSLALVKQARAAGVGQRDTVAVSVGTNDAAPWKCVPVPQFVDALTALLRTVEARAWVYVAPPGVIEDRLNRTNDRTNSVIDDYRTAALQVCAEEGAHVVRADRLVGPLGPAAFTADGVHLSGLGYRTLLPALADAITCSGP